MKEHVRVAKFWERVEKTDDCWTWRGSLNNSGYGIAKFPGSSGAHRLSYMINVGPIPVGKQVLHRCDNRSCVRPGHLFLGTHADNHADKVAKGRHTRGAAVHTSKITEDDVVDIRSLAAFGAGVHDLAWQFGVGERNIHHILARKSWASV